jgi:hypothetical protein
MTMDNRDPVRALALLLKALDDQKVGPPAGCDDWDQVSSALDYQVESALAAARAAISTPSGWKLVPIEPTEAMCKAGGHANSEWLNDNAPIGEARYAMPMLSVWRAMLDAADSPKHAQSEDAPLPAFLANAPLVERPSSLGTIDEAAALVAEAKRMAGGPLIAPNREPDWCLTDAALIALVALARVGCK